MRDPLQIVYFALALLIGLAIHEASHAFTADQLGDPTPRAMGRLTLNPIAHLDAAGTIALVVSSLFGYGIGWGKPVPVNPNNLRRGPLGKMPNGPLLGMAIVALAGPVSNLLQAIVGAQVLRLDVLPTRLVGVYILVNVILAIFNMIPIPPLDGYRVLLGILPTGPAYKLARLEPWGPGVLILLVFMAPGILSSILSVFSKPILQFIAGTM